MITTAIGLVLVFLILSLLVTSIQEIIAGWFSMRGHMLEEVLEIMLTNKSLEQTEEQVEKTLFHKFQAHNWYQNLKMKNAWYQFIKKRSPSYLSPSAFATILLHVLDGSDAAKLEANISKMSDGKLKVFLLDMLKDTDNNISTFRKKIEHWYDETMDRASGWYKRKVHQIILIVGLVVAVIFNADTVAMYQKLSIDPDARIAVLSDAQQLLGQNLVRQDSAYVKVVSLDNFTALQTEIHTLLGEDIAAVESPLGLGWHTSDYKQLNEEGLLGWLKKILGLVVTALAISLGAPFWFDLLKRFMHIRNTGIKSPTQQIAI